MLISVVLPVYDVAAYLPRCLDSVLGQPGTAAGLEVIAVDDGSGDGSGAILEKRAISDDRLTVIRLDRNAGPGNARNIGLARAAGDYVWFADADDLVAPGGLGAISASLEQDRPDVLLIDHASLDPRERTRPSHGAALLRDAPPGTFTLADDPQVINLTMTAWSKVLRRDFLLGLGEPFRSGIHEDIPVTCAALFAGRLSALARVCYLYRMSRPGSAMTRSTGQQAVFSAYAEVLQMLGKRAEAGDPVATPKVRCAVFERAIWHYAAILQTPGLVPRAERRQFFERMHADFAGYLPPGYRLPAGARGAKLKLIERNAYLAYEVLEPLNRLRVTLRGRHRPRAMS
jgi:CDP-glycerol glycerophosphotransferase